MRRKSFNRSKNITIDGDTSWRADKKVVAVQCGAAALRKSGDAKGWRRCSAALSSKRAGDLPVDTVRTGDDQAASRLTAMALDENAAPVVLSRSTAVGAHPPGGTNHITDPAMPWPASLPLVKTALTASGDGDSSWILAAVDGDALFGMYAKQA